MCKVNKHGIKMEGLKAAAGETKGLTGYYSGRYVEIFYDTDTGEIITRYQVSLGQNSWTVYHDPAIIKICNASAPLTMQDIANAIKEAMDRRADMAN